MFSPNFQLPGPGQQHPWHVWTQWHGDDDNGPTYEYGVPIEFDLTGNMLSLQVFNHHYENCYVYDITCGYLWREPLTKGIWYELLVHIKWSTKSDGVVEGKVKLIDSSGKEIAVHPFQTYHGNTLNNSPTAPLGDKSVYLKQEI